MTSFSQIITPCMKAQFDLEALSRNTPFGQDIQSHESFGAFSFSETITPTNAMASYLIILCPELNYRFLELLQDERNLFSQTFISAAIPTLSSRESNAFCVSFIQSKNLEFEFGPFTGDDLNALIRLLVPISKSEFEDLSLEEYASIPGLVETSETDEDGKANLNWFKTFGPHQSILRPFNLSPNGWDSIPVVQLGLSEMDTPVIQLYTDCSVQKAWYSQLKRIRLDQIEFHLLGAFLIQPITPSLSPLTVSWNYTISKFDLYQTHRIEIPVVLGREGDGIGSERTQACLVLLEPFPLNESLRYPLSEKRFHSTAGRITCSVQAPSDSELDTVQSLVGVFKPKRIQTAQTTGLDGFLETGRYVVGPQTELETNAFFTTIGSSSVQNKAIPLNGGPISVKESFDDHVPVWSLSGRGKGNALKLLSSATNSFFLPKVFVPGLNESSAEWEVKIGSLVSVRFDPRFDRTLTRDQTIVFHLEFDTRIQIDSN